MLAKIRSKSTIASSDLSESTDVGILQPGVFLRQYHDSKAGGKATVVAEEVSSCMLRH